MTIEKEYRSSLLVSWHKFSSRLYRKSVACSNKWIKLSHTGRALRKREICNGFFILTTKLLNNFYWDTNGCATDVHYNLYFFKLNVTSSYVATIIIVLRKRKSLTASSTIGNQTLIIEKRMAGKMGSSSTLNLQWAGPLTKSHNWHKCHHSSKLSFPAGRRKTCLNSRKFAKRYGSIPNNDWRLNKKVISLSILSGFGKGWFVLISLKIPALFQHIERVKDVSRLTLTRSSGFWFWWTLVAM